MSMIRTLNVVPRLHAPASAGLRQTVVRGVKSLGKQLRRWARNAITRRQLLEIDDRMLSDLGISRAQAAFEVSRRPWQGTAR